MWTSREEAPIWILKFKPEFFQTSFLQLQKIHATCKDHFYAWFSSIGQMAFNSLQGVIGNKGKNLVADWKKKTFDSRQEVKVRP